MPGWTADDIPDLTGRRAVVTGASSGLGLVTARELARHGAEVTLACRDLARGNAALADVAAAAPGASAAVGLVDLADLASVRAFAAQWRADHPGGLDLLVNNAGVMAVPRSTTIDGFERQVGTNHLGHVLLTAELLPALLERPGARVVTVSSNAHRAGRLDRADLMGERRYTRWGQYGRSKLANLLFALELARRADAAGAPLISAAAHPGYAATNLTTSGPASGIPGAGAVMRAFDRVLGQSPAMGALPQLYAATAPGVGNGTYWGPDGFASQRGYPAPASMSGAAASTADAAWLWDESVRLTGASFDW